MSEPRAVLHVDMDAFYAAVEQRDDPALRGQPVAVGGAGRRGVVAAASYEARRFGVRSAMAGREARARCPELVFLQPRMAHYRAESARVFAIFARFTPLIEPLSLDEAFLDVTASRTLHGSAVMIARAIKREVHRTTGLVASVGVAGSKFLAKLASDEGKPDGLVRIGEAERDAYLDPMPVERMWGVGPKSAPRLREAGFRTFRDLRTGDPATLATVVGSTGADRLRRLAAGDDDRPVQPERRERSISNETTLEEDLTEAEACRCLLLALARKVAARVRQAGLAGRTVQVKIRTAPFHTVTRSRTLDQPTAADGTIAQAARALFDGWWSRAGPARIRLLGVGVSQLVEPAQGDLFGAAAEALDAVGDGVRERFGPDALRPARLVDGKARRAGAPGDRRVDGGSVTTDTE